MDASAGTEWIAATGNPTMATINPSTGAITGLTAIGVYTFTLQNISNPTCKDDMIVTVNASAPNVICNDGFASITAIAQSGLTNVVWFNSTGTQVGVGNSLIINSNTAGLNDGTEWFYYTADNGSNCNAELCCPVLVITEICCPTTTCFGVTVTKN